MTIIKNLKPIDATIAVTYDCNSRCQMCNIWQAKNGANIPLDAFYNLSPNLKYINLSGGEPFLREDLPEIVKIIKQICPKAQIIISSNGLATEKIINTMKKILAIDEKAGVRISIDGLGKTHDVIRGIPNMYLRAWITIRKLREISVKNLGISFTIMQNNINDLIPVYNLARENNLQFALALVQNSEIYFGKKNNQSAALYSVERGLNHVINSELKSFNPKQWLRAFYDYGLKYYAQNQERLFPSGAGFDSLFIGACGQIYPSNLINLKIANIADNKLDDIWASEKIKAVRKEIIDKKITESWIICTVRGEMKKHPIKVLFWVLKNKLKLIFDFKIFKLDKAKNIISVHESAAD
ncbi:MAG: radical SAM protein [Patescibacteria group bacterium]|nr:radical SAM protein [Patescibacteria group bacterium]